MQDENTGLWLDENGDIMRCAPPEEPPDEWWEG